MEPQKEEIQVLVTVLEGDVTERYVNVEGQEVFRLRGVIEIYVNILVYFLETFRQFDAAQWRIIHVNDRRCVVFRNVYHQTTCSYHGVDIAFVLRDIAEIKNSIAKTDICNHIACSAKLHFPNI